MLRKSAGPKWAEFEEDDEELDHRLVTAPDEHGIKTVIEYTMREGKTYKITKHVKQKTITNWTNSNIADRKTMNKFGKALENNPDTERFLVVKSEEDVNIEVSKKVNAAVNSKDDAEDKFHEESLAMAENLTKEKKVWTDVNREKQEARDTVAAPAATPEAKAAADKAAAPAPGAPGKYVPPSLRQGARPDGKGGGKGGNDFAAQQEASLRITNLSDDAREGDLWDLFSAYGRLQRVYLAKDKETNVSRGFAFVTYFNREDANKAIAGLNGYGYDNLILQVQFAKPRQ